MNPQTLIRIKRDGGQLTTEQIEQFVSGYVDGSIADYQMSAMAMAILLRGMTITETAALTQAMLSSGTTMQWSFDDGRPVVDKHSTGGVGDKVSLLLAPLLACEEVRVPMISGRGLGPTGGTLDKLESITGFRTDLTLDEIRAVTNQVGCVITGASAEIAPADRQLYALRDVTATVESIPLITASIMSKKLAEGLKALILDVKVGSGAFMKTRDDALALARSLVDTGNAMNVATSALLTDMNQPLGRMIGNAVEVDETISSLKGEGPADLLEVSLALGAKLLLQVGRYEEERVAQQQLQSHIHSGMALAKLRDMVAAQGGNLDVPRPVADKHVIKARASGCLQAINTQRLGEVVIELGGGRKVKSDSIDHSVGLEMLARVGDPIESGQPLVNVFAPAVQLPRVRPMIDSAIQLGDDIPAPLPLIVESI